MSTKHDNSTLCLSFAAGVLSASVAWYCLGGSSGGRSATDDQVEVSRFLRWMTMNDIKSRIGELPSLQRSRTRWPWDRKGRSRTSSPSSSQHHYNGSAASPPPPPCGDTPTKSDFCIGSIFGLDVGGTLAKLVYFEQKSEQADSEFGPSLRERLYRCSASAQAVVLARRGLAVDDQGKPARRRSSSNIDDWKPSKTSRRRKRLHRNGALHSVDSDDDLNLLYTLRQESVPDDLHAYGESIRFREQRFHTTESMDDLKTDAPSSGLRKSRSMFDFSKSRNEALDRFYNFARRLDSYREGIKDHELSFYSRELGGEFHFIRFETRRMQNAMDLIRANNLHLNIREMGATGGGAHKFADQWNEELGITMKKQDELDSLVAGMQFVLSTVVGECYTFRPQDDPTSKDTSRHSTGSTNSEDFNIGAPIEEEDEVEETPGTEDRGKGDGWWWSRKVQRDAISYSSTYPYMLVTIGTGVSILRVDGPRKHERVSGSTIGGGTYWGLIRLLTDLEDFEDVMRLAERGDPSKVDMMVGDIYGKNSEVLEKIGLASDLVASSFGKLVAKDDPALGLKEEDLARALLLMVTNNIGQVAYLNAKLHQTPRIYFVGNFLRQNKISQRRLSFAIDYWSKGEMEALFLEHEGYFGALGAFLLSQDIGHEVGDRRAEYKSQQSMPASSFSSVSNGSGHPKLHKRSSTGTFL